MIQQTEQNATILAIDSATGPCSAALWRDGRVAAYGEERTASRQSARLLGMIEQVLAESGTAYSELSSIACTVGPGSFTGIRIALSAARGIGFAAGVPVRGFSALDVLAFGAAQQGKPLPLLVMLNAGKGETVYRHYGPALQAAGEPVLGVLEDILAAVGTPTLIAGCDYPPHPLAKHSGITFPRADLLAGLAVAHPSLACAPVPFYIRPPDAKISA